MKANELRNLDQGKLQKALEDAKKELIQLGKSSKKRNVRRQIARILTIMNERKKGITHPKGVKKVPKEEKKEPAPKNLENIKKEEKKKQEPEKKKEEKKEKEEKRNEKQKEEGKEKEKLKNRKEKKINPR